MANHSWLALVISRFPNFITKNKKKILTFPLAHTMQPLCKHQFQ